MRQDRLLIGDRPQVGSAPGALLRSRQGTEGEAAASTTAGGTTRLPKLTELVTRSRLLTTLSAATLSLLTLAALMSVMHRHDAEEHAQEFTSDAAAARDSVHLHLRANAKFTSLLASEFARDALDEEAFRRRSTAYLGENPAMTHLFLLPPGGAPWVVQSTLGEAGGEPHLLIASVRETLGNGEKDPDPRFIPLLDMGGGEPVLGVYAPIPGGGNRRGLVGARYTLAGVLQHTVPAHVRDRNRVSWTGADGTTLVELGSRKATDDRLTHREQIETLGVGLQLQLDCYSHHVFDLEVWLMAALCVGLTAAMSRGMWTLVTVAEERRAAQEMAQRERDNLVNVFEAMEDGVAVVNTTLDVEYVNPILVKDFGPYTGRKCYEYFHGHREKCRWCMMDDVIAGKAVHTEWCYPRNGRTYDLIDTRVENADGSVSKLKMFRDMTERAKDQAALRESEERFHHLFESAADALFLHDADGRIIEVNQAASETLGRPRGEFRNLHMGDIAPGYAPPAIRADGSAGPPATVLAEQRRGDGSTFPVEIRAGTMDSGGTPLILASVRDITERRRAEAAIQRQLQMEKTSAAETRRGLAESESLQRVATALLQKITLEDVLTVVCEEARQLTGATGSGVLLLEEDLFRVRHWTGTPPASTASLPVAGSFGGLAIQSEAPTLLNDISRYDLACYRDQRPHALLAVPLRLEGKVIGVLDVAGGPQGFDDAHTRVLGHLGNLAAIAIETARLRHQAEQVAVVEERQRLARELHDSVTQALYSLSLYADAARIALDSDKTGVAAGHLDELRTLAREAMLEMRLLIFELHPPALEKEGLIGALRTRLATVETRAGLATEIFVDGEEAPLTPGVEEALYRFAQEALTNVIKHAEAEHVWVWARYRTGAVELAVRDDGLGFDPHGTGRKGGMGMGGMQERLRTVGGTLTVESSPGYGASLRARVPLC